MEFNSNNKHSNKKCQVKITRNINLVVKFVTVQNKLKAKTRCGEKETMSVDWNKNMKFQIK